MLAPEVDLLVGGKYQLVRKLASGGMGAVWVARHVDLDAEVAVKFVGTDVKLDRVAFARVEREAKASALLKSPHIVRVFDFGIDRETPYMAMELLEGEDLGERIDRAGRLSLAETAAIASSVAKALECAHAAGVVHRDLKPKNVFLAREGGDTIVKLLDFGIARETLTTWVEESTTTGLILGSPYHMAPEQAQGLPVDHRADLWALGVVLYRALVGRRPFEGDNPTVVLLAICSRAHPEPSTVDVALPPAADAFFRKALAKDPDDRFPSARAMAECFRVEVAGLDAGPSSSAPLAAASLATAPPVARGGPSPRGRSEETLAAPVAAPASVRAEAAAIVREHTPSTDDVALVTDGRLPVRRLRRGLVALGVLSSIALSAWWLSTRGAAPAATNASTDVEGAPAGVASGPRVAPMPAGSERQIDPLPATSATSVDAVASSTAATASATTGPAAQPAPPRATARPSATPAARAPSFDPFTGLLRED
jgi:hypothetical protein